MLFELVVQPNCLYFCGNKICLNCKQGRKSYQNLDIENHFDIVFYILFGVSVRAVIVEVYPLSLSRS